MSHKLILLVMMLLTSLLVSGSQQDVDLKVQSTQNINPTIQPGMTIWYNVDEFLDFNGLSTIFGDGSTLITTSGSLIDSKIYAKIISIDNSQEIPVMDYNIGLITGSPIQVSFSTSAGGISKQIPAGAGLPFPLIFGSSTSLNISDPSKLIYPTPLVLNDDTNGHLIDLNDLQSKLGSNVFEALDLNSQFGFVLNNYQINENVTLSGTVTWEKSTGLLNSLSFTYNNIDGTSESFAFSLDSMEINWLSLSVGDIFQINLAEFNLLVESLPASIDQGTMEEFIGLIDSFEGFDLIKLEVVAISGLRYKAEISVDIGSGFTDIKEIVTTFPEVWFSAFGRIGPGMPIPLFNSAISDHRLSSIPGPITTPDWEIYESWDVTTEILLTDGLELVLLFGSVLEAGLEDFEIYSSLNSNPIVLTSVDYSINEAGYDLSIFAAWDIVIRTNQSLIDNNITDPFNDWVLLHVNSQGDFTFDVEYQANGVLKTMGIASVLINSTSITTYQNGTTEEIHFEINSLNIQISVEHTQIIPQVSSSSTSTSPTQSTMTTSTSSEGNGDSPGFIVVGIILSLGLIVILRKPFKLN